MPLPKVLTSFGASDVTAARTLANVKSTVDPLLQFVNGTFAVANDGTLSFLRRIKTFAADSIVANSSFVANGPSTLNKGQTITGDQNITGTQRVIGTSVIQKLPDGSQGSQLVQGNQSVLGTTSSSTGFKSTQDMGTVWTSSAVVGTRYQAKRFLQNDAAASTYNAPTLFQPMYAGSIIGIHTYSQGTAGGNAQVQIFKNQTLVNSGLTPLIQTAPQSAGQYFGNQTLFAKGAFPFFAQDYFSASGTFSVAGNNLIIITLIVEYTA